jgi:hypothetical protein
MRAAKVSRNLAHGSRLPVSEQIERGDLREGELTGCQLLRRREDQLTPEAADGDDATADFAKALPAS